MPHRIIAGTHIETNRSPDDRGWYAVILGRKGQSLHTTDLYLTERAACGAAHDWILDHARKNA